MIIHVNTALGEKIIAVDQIAEIYTGITGSAEIRMKNGQVYITHESFDVVGEKFQKAINVELRIADSKKAE